MERTHFFLQYQHGTMTKNRLQKEVDAFLRSLDGTIVENHMVVHVQQTIIKKIQDLNVQYKNCTPLHPQFYDTRGRYVLNGAEFACFYILPGKLVKFFTP